MALLDETFFGRVASDVAPELIGCKFFVAGVGGIIAETEAYTKQDPASHSFRGLTRRNSSMFGPHGRAYVYRIYGLHWCMNFVCADASAVLLRAIIPLEGMETMTARRGGATALQLCSGPAKLSEALGITGELDGASLFTPPFKLIMADDKSDVVCGERIGISKAKDVAWRFWLANCPYVSGPRLRSR